VFFYLIEPRGELDNQVHIVGLGFGFVGGFVADDSAASVAFMDYYIAALCVGLGFYRAEDTAALVRSVAGVYIDV